MAQSPSAYGGQYAAPRGPIPIVKVTRDNEIRFKNPTKAYKNMEGYGKGYSSVVNSLAYDFWAFRPKTLGGLALTSIHASPTVRGAVAGDAAKYINAGRTLDRRVAPVRSLNKAQNEWVAQKQSSATRGNSMQHPSNVSVDEITLPEFLCAEYALSKSRVRQRQPTHRVVEKISSPFARKPVDTPMCNTPYAYAVHHVARNLDAKVGGLDKISSVGKSSFSEMVKASAGIHVPPAHVVKTSSGIGGILKDTWKLPLSQKGKVFAAMAAGLPLAIGGLALIDKAYGTTATAINSSGAQRKFNNAIEVATQSPDVREELTDPATGQYDKERMRALRSDFGSLVKYAPNVAKDPRLAGRYLETMAFQSGHSGDPSMYLRNIKDFTDLEKGIQGTKPSINTSLFGML